MDRTVVREFSSRILEWWRRWGRDFPWRRTKDPYKVLIAEILLRKTTAAQVVKMYESFLSEYPNPSSLAAASEERLKELLRPLGMEHRRAELLIKLGRTIEEKYKGKLPSSIKELTKLPGVGRYAAGAVLCLAYGADEPMVDTNAVRLIQRVFGFRSSRARPRDDPKIWAFAKSLIPRGMGKEFNLAVIDFASAVCTARNPKCNVCPLKDICYFYRSRRE